MLANRKINFFLALSSVSLLFLALLLWARIYFIGSYVSGFRKNLSRVMGSTDSGILKNVDANDFVLFNFFTVDDPSHRDSLWLSKYVLGSYRNVSVYNLILGDGARTNGGTCASDAGTLEKFLRRHNIATGTICLDSERAKKYLALAGPTRVVVTDRRYTPRGSFDDPRDTRSLEKSLAAVARRRVFYSRARLGDGDEKPSAVTDEYLLNSLTRIILIKNFDGTPAPLLAILDSYGRRVLIAKFTGEILYILESEHFCLPSSIKWVDDRIFVLDSCSGSLGYVDFERQKFLVLRNSEHLRGATDFELLKDGSLLFSGTGGGSLSFLREGHPATPGGVDPAGEVDIVKKFNGNFYYLDRKNRVLRSLEGETSRVLLELDRVEGIGPEVRISNFYVNRENDIYLIDTLDHKIFRCSGGQCSRQLPEEVLPYPNDLVLYKNLMFIATDSHVQLFDVYSGKSSRIDLRISENTRYLSDTLNSLEPTSIGSVLEVEELLAMLQSTGPEGAGLLNPSFLLFLRDYDGKLFIERFLNYENILRNENIYSTENGGSIVYGKLFHSDSGEIKIRTLVTRVADRRKNRPRDTRANRKKLGSGI